MTPHEKQQAVKEIGELFSGAPAAFLVDYKGCDCEALNELRSNLRASGSRFAVVKNTLAKRAVEGTAVAEIEKHFTGPTGVVWAGDDPVSPAKVVAEFAKAQETFSLKAGVVDGATVGPSEIENLATLPTKDELVAKLLALMNAPAVKLLQTINAPAQNLVQLLNAWRAEKE